MYKAPRDRLVCILNCCKVIGNLLLHASISSEDVPEADEFLPVLIYVTIKANPPQLHSNLLYIQRYRSQSRLVAEAAYIFTNMLSAESFISNIDAKALSMDETEFESNMETARALLSGISSDFDGQSNQSDYRFGGDISRAEPMESKHQSLNVYKDKDSTIQPKSSESKSRSKEVPFAEEQLTKIPSLSDLENKGATMLLKEDTIRQVFRDYPYVFANVGDLTVNDVEDLLNNYKQLVFKYVSLAKGLGVTPLASSSPQSQKQQHPEATKEPEDTRAVKPNESPLASSNSESQNNSIQKSQRNLKILELKNQMSQTSKLGLMVIQIELHFWMRKILNPSCHRMRLLKMGEMMRLHKKFFLNHVSSKSLLNFRINGSHQAISFLFSCGECETVSCFNFCWQRVAAILSDWECSEKNLERNGTYSLWLGNR